LVVADTYPFALCGQHLLGEITCLPLLQERPSGFGGSKLNIRMCLNFLDPSLRSKVKWPCLLPRIGDTTSELRLFNIHYGFWSTLSGSYHITFTSVLSSNSTARRFNRYTHLGRRRWKIWLSAVSEAISPEVTGTSHCYRNHNLDPAIIGSSGFGQIFKTALPGNFNGIGPEQIFSQPLVLTGNDGVQYVYVATTQNNIYKLDAKSGVIVASRNLAVPFLTADLDGSCIPLAWIDGLCL